MVMMVDPVDNTTRSPPQTVPPGADRRPRTWKRRTAALPPSTVAAKISRAVMIQCVSDVTAPAAAGTTPAVEAVAVGETSASAERSAASTATKLPSLVNRSTRSAADVDGQTVATVAPVVSSSVAPSGAAAADSRASILGGGKPFSMSAVQQRNLALYVVAKSRLLAQDKEEMVQENGTGAGTTETAEMQ